MGYPTKVQLIKRKQSEQWYINFPAAVAQAMEFQRGETVEWIIEDKANLVLRRLKVPLSAMKKNTWNSRGIRSFVQANPAGICSGAHLRAYQDTGDKLFGWLRAKDYQRTALRHFPAIPRLVSRISGF